MEYTYEIITSNLGELLKRTDTNDEVTWIPMVTGNTDYDFYLNSGKLVTDIVPASD